MVSRLAYVENMKTILVSENENFLHENFPLLNRICHRILENNANDYQLTFGAGKFESNIRGISDRIRVKQIKMYERHLRIFQLGMEENKNFSSFQIEKRYANEAITESWSGLRLNVKDSYILDGFFIAFKRKTSMSFKETFNNLMTLSFFMNYSIHDEGISYRKALEYPKMINSNFSFLRENGSDPYKYIRFLAFMGLSPIQTDSLDTCFSIKDKLKQKWQKRINPQRHF